MKKITLFLVLLSFTALRADEANLPTFLLKARVLPTTFSLLTSLLGETLDHAFMVDAEYVVSEKWTVGLSVGHSHITTASTLSSPRVNDYREEWTFGLLATHYFSGLKQPNSWFIRGHAYLMMVDADPYSGSSTTTYQNIATKSSGSRAGLEVGYSNRDARNFWWELSGGFSAYLNNPFRPYQGTYFMPDGSEAAPGWIKNLFQGVGDIYPTANFAIGFGF